MKLLRSLVFLLLSLILLPSTIVSGAEESAIGGKPWEYNLGEGLRIAASDFFIGGYINAEYLDESVEDGAFILDDISFFIFGDITPKFRFFSELEDEEALEIETDGDVETHENWQVERLYFDYLYREKLNIRVGKFLTPIGTWNEIHAAPLTWTVSRPAVTIASFPEFVTGIQFFGNLSIEDEDFSYSFSAQNNESISERTSFRKTHRFYGGRIKWFGPPGLEIGVPFLYYTERKVDDDIYLTGIDFSYKKSGFEVRLEANFGHVELQNGQDSKEYGYYIQGVYALTDKLFLIARHDYFNAREDLGDHKAISLATTYKLRPQIVFKAEGQLRSGDLVLGGDTHINNNERLLASFSVLL